MAAVCCMGGASLVGHMMVEVCMERLKAIRSELGPLGAFHAKFDPFVDLRLLVDVWTLVD